LQPHDPLTIGLAVFVLLAVAAVADLLPAGEIVGAIGDIRHRGFDADPAPTIYACYQ
jgi:hypothetical protein